MRDTDSMDPHLQFKKCVRAHVCVCVSMWVCVCVSVSQPDSAGRQVSLLTADEIECLLTQGASATRAHPHLCSSVHLV